MTQREAVIHTPTCGSPRISGSDLLDCITEIIEHARDGAIRAAPQADAIPVLVKLTQEAALLALLARRTLGDAPSVQRLLGAIAGRRDVLDQLFSTAWLRPHRCFPCGFTHAVLAGNGLGDPREHDKLEELRRVWGVHPVRAAERLPFGVLDDAWTAMVSGHGTVAGIRDRQVYVHTGLANLKAAPWMDDFGLYTITHTAMYTTDFGSLPPLAPVEPGWLGPLALAMLLEDDYDLAGELAAAAIYVERPRPWAEVTIVSNAAARVFAARGYIPSPQFDEEALRRAPDASHYVWSNTYHTTLVYGLLNLAASNTGAAEVSALFQPENNWPLEGVSALSRSHEPVTDRVSLVFSQWRALVPAEVRCDGLLRSTVDAFLIQAVRRDAFEDINALLHLAAVVGPSPVDVEVRRVFETQTAAANAITRIGCGVSARRQIESTWQSSAP
ncbi:hypothetical protein IUS99_06135 [Mycobacteroides abscessus subsp. massiliense]|uniref:DUF6895 family protein n=1 Tax=Mycobacteroides abscessus TaxID=36809 RepID=UPI0019CF8C92|nr:hypothetical protein [Mycobacteroides abscessus]MBN7316332.1 hypothetical protein [Mycobacteroides abscessus subsp. massiliense]